MQAITTKYFGPSNVRGSRVKATAQAGSITLGWDCSLNYERNHARAARALAAKLNWTGQWIGGGLPGESSPGMVWLASDARDAFFVIPNTAP